MDMYNIERTTFFKGVEYQIIDVFRSGMLLVVEKNEFERGDFPLPSLIIPSE